MDSPLSGSWAKFYRGDDHRKTLNAEIAGLLKGDDRPPIEIGFHFEPDTSSYLVVAARVINLTHLGLIFGDAIQNYRSALDLLVCQLLRLGGIEPGNRHAWPATTSEQGWASAKGDQLAGVKTDHVAIIERYQPKEAGEHAQSHPFAMLASLSNRDKHQVITPLPVSLAQLNVDDVQVLGCDLVKVEPLYKEFGGPLKPGAELARVWLRNIEPNHQVDMNAQFTLQPTLQDGIPMYEMLHLIRSRVVNVLSEFERIL